VRFARLASTDGPIYARLEADRAYPLDTPPWRASRPGAVPSGALSRPWTSADLLCPVEPSKIVCVGRNYAAHAKEMGGEVPVEPLLFLKPPSSLIGPSATIILPRQSARVEHESELAVVIGRRASNVSAAEALGVVCGFTAANDVTARDLQKKDGQWTRAKGFDTFCPVGPWIETEIDPGKLRVQCRVNGEVRQDGHTTQMIFDVAALIAYVSRIMTLEAGDLVLTGTPEGVGPLLPGDVCEVEIGDEAGTRGIGVLRSVVRAG
jgi:2-keto-4-pentenoate hydratase/2-oxohepta-3-ene-1,7-dioic acid hydratase in catechol pathway